VYYLAINNISLLKLIFPSFWVFSVLALSVGVPLAIFMGFFHFKRSQAYSAEVDIGVEANPYYYKVTQERKGSSGFH
jgi:ABC-type branched-subunit amino acid transport system permease subunit